MAADDRGEQRLAAATSHLVLEAPLMRERLTFHFDSIPGLLIFLACSASAGGLATSACSSSHDNAAGGAQAGVAGVAVGAAAAVGGGAGAAISGTGAISAGSGALPSSGRGASASAGTTANSIAGVGGAAGSSGSGAASGRGAAGAGSSSAPRFSFFMTSQAGMAKLAGNALGFGGDLKFGKLDGLAGADEICRQLAETSMPANAKTWRAFLSVTKGPDGKPVHAIDRIGQGPWYDRTERIFATSKAALLNTRPQGADPLILNDFPNEDGVPNHNPGTGVVDNHNVLTGSTAQGMLDAQGLTATCQDWTSSTQMGGKPRCGVSWPRGQLQHWISTLNEGGCAPGATPPGAESGAQATVGALGGYGGFYCFAMTP